LSENENETAQAEVFVTLAGERLSLIMPGKGWTFDEALLAKSVTPREWGPVEIEERLWVGDPDAWLAVLHVSYKRAGKPFPDKKIGDVNLSEIAEAVMGAIEEAGGVGPPPAAEDEAEPVPSSA
jgi:hypothetical protein